MDSSHTSFIKLANQGKQSMTTVTVVPEVSEPEVMGKLDLMNAEGDLLAVADYWRQTAAPEASKAQNSLSESLRLSIVRILEAGHSLSEYYNHLRATHSNKVAKVARTREAASEAIAGYRNGAETTLKQNWQPFWNLSHICSTDEGSEGILAEAKKDKASLGRVKTYARDMTDTLIFNPKHWEEKDRTITFRQKEQKGAAGENSTITVAKAAASLARYQKAQAAVKKLSEENGPEWREVRARFRKLNPAGMVDMRTKAETQKAAVESATKWSVARNQYTDSEIETLRNGTTEERAALFAK